MPYSNRHAPEDTAIRREALEQNIEVRGVGRYYPEEYTGQINAIRQRGDLIADVPKTLAGIVLNYDDYKIGTWANQEQQKINDDAMFYKQLEANKRKLMDLEADVEVNDKTVELNADLLKAKEEALNNDSSVQDAYAAVFDKYKDTYQDIPALAQRFQPKLQEREQHAMANGLATDIQTGKQKAASRFVMEFNNQYQAVIQGDMSSVDAMNELIKNSSQWYQYLPATDVEVYLQKFYNSLVQGEAQHVLNLYREGTHGITAQMAMDTLRGLHNSAQQIDGTLVDKEGNPLKDGQGNLRTIPFTLSEETQIKLEQALTDLKSGGKDSGEDDGIMPDISDDFDKRINWEQIEKEGYSDKLLSIGQDGLDSWYDEFVHNLMNSNASDSSKAKKLDETYRKYKTCATLLKVSDLAKEAKTDVATIMRTAADTLNRDLTNGNFSKDWEKYDISFTINGKSFTLGTAALTKKLNAKYGETGLMPHLGTTQNEAELYWQDLYNVLNIAANNVSKNNTSEFMNKYNADYNAASGNIENKLNTEQLFRPDAKGNLKLNYGMQAQIETELATIKKEADKAGFKNAVSPSQIDKYINKITSDIHDPVQKFQAFELLGNAFANQGMLPDLLRYSKQKAKEQGSDLVYGQTNKEANDGAITSIMALKDVPSIRGQVLDMFVNGTYTDNLAIAANTNNKSALEANMENVFEDLGIPKADRKMFAPLSNMCAALSVEQSNNKNFNARIYKDAFKKVLSEQYLQAPNHFMQDNGLRGKALLKNATYMQPFYQQGKSIDTVSDITTSAMNTINEIRKNNKELEPLLTNAEFYPDAEEGMIRMRVGGKDITNLGDATNRYAGVVIYNKDLKNVDPKLIGQAVALGAVSSLMFGDASRIYKENSKSNTQKESLMKKYRNEQGFKAACQLTSRLLNNPKVMSDILKKASNPASKGAIQSVYSTNSPFAILQYDIPLLITPGNVGHTSVDQIQTGIEAVKRRRY